jgi:hypothetical protein
LRLCISSGKRPKPQTNISFPVSAKPLGRELEELEEQSSSFRETDFAQLIAVEEFSLGDELGNGCMNLFPHFRFSSSSVS